MFVQRNQLILEGTCLEELYEGAEYAKRAGCNEVYLFTNSWRHGFMAHDQLNCELRSDIYKNGESDLRTYSDYLWEKGIRLNIHYVSGGLGIGDKKYVVNPDDRLACYGEFELVGDISESDTEILVKPLNGSELPYLVDDCDAYIRLPGLYGKYFSYLYIRIGQEIIKVGAFENTDQEVWTLKDCQRGGNTVLSDHKVDEQVRGLITAYNHFLPDNDTTLLTEVAETYAGLLNNCRISHTEYDGCELHNYVGNWGFQKFASIVYENLDHPVTSHDSGAIRPKCHIEYRLNKTKKILEGTCSYSHGNYSIPFTLNSNSRPAVNKLDSHYTLSQGYKGGALGLAKPEPMFGIRPKELDAHGQIDDLMDILKTWRDVAANLTAEQREIIENSFKYLPDRYERSKHLASGNVFVAKKSEDKLSLVPTTVMTREKGDTLWIHGQEHGAIPPKQYIKLNDSLTLKNPNSEQTPKFTIRLAQNYDYNMETKSTFDFQEVAGKAEELEHLFEAGNSADSDTDELAINCNMLLDPKQEDFSGQSITKVQVTDSGYVFEANNSINEDYYEAYKLPSFECRTNMAGHRGIGMTITGDGSGSIFIVQIAGRDYVVPIDFTGEKYIEILNGEVSWHEERWGWRMGTKHTRYSMVTWFKTGFCHVPASTQTSIIVRDIKLLKELEVPLKELTISNSTGSIKIFADIQTGDYIEYSGNETAVIYDSNYHKKQKVAVENNNFIAPTGYETYNFKADKEVWVEVQMTTEGKELVVG